MTTYNNPYPVKISRRYVIRHRARVIRAQYAYARARGYARARAVVFAFRVRDLWIFDI